MNPKIEHFLSILFDEGESVCVSPDKFAYRSIPVEELGRGAFELVSNKGDKKLVLNLSDISLVSINPIVGNREDSNCTAFRTFLVELDGDTLGKQFDYVKSNKMPYSACVFSGNKSLHFAIVLENPLPNIDSYRLCAEWILNIMSKADPNTKNPSRSIRFPYHIRDGKEQKLIYLGSRISTNDLWAWLSEYPALKPQTVVKKERVTNEADFNLLPDWVQKELSIGINTDKGRNNRWFAIAYEFGLQNFDEDDTVNILEMYFDEDRDFKRKEWEYTVRHAVKRAQQRN